VKTIALSEAKDRLSALVEEADSTHEIIQITRHGHPAAVLMSADDLDSLHETLFWLSQPNVRNDVAEAREASAAGTTTSGADLRARFGLPPR
jgi:prevent-host-death family protein